MNEENQDQTVDSTTQDQTEEQHRAAEAETDGPQPVGPNEDGDTGAPRVDATTTTTVEPANDPVLGEGVDQDNNESNLEAARQDALANAESDKPQL